MPLPHERTQPVDTLGFSSVPIDADDLTKYAGCRTVVDAVRQLTAPSAS
ncbi:hypothetical protein JOF53_007377 [Crossiella equi]|uniref:Uncharacterized protein n=1 Tax=Crossiella equi TaxID=130796 RepID=A0ABS5APN6_9PSEU|nr:hypothetical protein [Crossiella equi]MBP2478505.1 hypothetical protein [Crossiella equi]